MKIKVILCIALGLLNMAPLFGDPSLTIYNGGFALVRDDVLLDLKNGTTTITYSNATAHAEPQSVVLRDPKSEWNLTVLEQNYRADPISQGLLLSLFEGKTIEFEKFVDGKPQIVEGLILRSGYVPHVNAYSTYGQHYQARQQAVAHDGGGQPIIEIDGKLRFGPPGMPIFPSLRDDTILRPTLEWLIASDRQNRLDAEVSYLTRGMRWLADYNLIALENSDTVEFVGWITMDNQSDRSFEEAKIKLMAGDVNKVIEQHGNAYAMRMAELAAYDMAAPQVEEKAFDDFHLYTINRKTTLSDRETKQVEFIRASGVKAKRTCV